MRELTNIFQGMTLAKQADFGTPLDARCGSTCTSPPRVPGPHDDPSSEMADFEVMVCDSIKKVGLKRDSPTCCSRCPTAITDFCDGHGPDVPAERRHGEAQASASTPS